MLYCVSAEPVDTSSAERRYTLSLSQVMKMALKKRNTFTTAVTVSGPCVSGGCL